MGLSAAALRKSLPFLGGLLSLLAFIAAGDLHQNRFPHDLFSPESKPRLAIDVLLFLLGMTVFITTTRATSTRAYGLLFAASAVLLASWIALPYWMINTWERLKPYPVISLIAEPGVVASACALWGATTAQRSSEALAAARRFGRIGALCAATFLSLLMVRLGHDLHGIYTMMEYFPGRQMTTIIQNHLFPTQIPTVLLAWACIEHLRPSDEASRPGRLKRSQWALLGWFCATLFLENRVADLVVLPAAIFAVQVLVTAFTAALSLVEVPASPETPA